MKRCRTARWSWEPRRCVTANCSISCTGWGPGGLSYASRLARGATAGEGERITEILLDALRESGYRSRRRVADAEQRIRRMVGRLHLPARDAELWRGMRAERLGTC